MDESMSNQWQRLHCSGVFLFRCHRDSRHRMQKADGADGPSAGGCTVALPIEREVIDGTITPGISRPSRWWNFARRVSGYIQKVISSRARCQEGGPALHDRRVALSSEFDRTTAQVAAAETQVEKTKSGFDRVEAVRATNAVSQEEYENRKFQYKSANSVD
jgi:hypothetical protein